MLNNKFGHITLLFMTLLLLQIQICNSENNSVSEKSELLKYQIQLTEGSTYIVPSLSLKQVIHDQIKSLMDRLGYIALEISDSPDLLIKVDYNVIPLSATYSGAGICFTGASISGHVAVIRNSSTNTKKFSGIEDVSIAVGSYCNEHPEAAPFERALENSNFLSMLVELFSVEGEVSKTQTLVLSLSSNPENSSIQKQIVAEGQAALPELIRYLNSDQGSAETKASIIRLLGKIGTANDEVVDTLIYYLKYGDDGSRLWSAWALGRLKAERAVELLAEILRSEKKWCYLRSNAIWAIGEIGSNQSYADLADVLQSQDTECIPEEVPAALRKIGGHEAISLIVTCLDDERYQVQRKAIQALEELTNQNFGSGLQNESWKKWWEENDKKYY